MRYVLAGAAVVLAIFMAMTWMNTPPADNGIPVVKAPAEPYKVRPEGWQPGDTE